MAAPVRARTARGRLGVGLRPSTATKVAVTPPHPGPPRLRPDSSKGYTPAPRGLPCWLARRHSRPPSRRNTSPTGNRLSTWRPGSAVRQRKVERDGRADRGQGSRCPSSSTCRPVCCRGRGRNARRGLGRRCRGPVDLVCLGEPRPSNPGGEGSRKGRTSLCAWSLRRGHDHTTTRPWESSTLRAPRRPLPRRARSGACATWRQRSPLTGAVGQADVIR